MVNATAAFLGKVLQTVEIEVWLGVPGSVQVIEASEEIQPDLGHPSKVRPVRSNLSLGTRQVTYSQHVVWRDSFNAIL